MISLRQLLKKTPKKIKRGLNDVFILLLITDSTIYYGNPEEGDDNGNTMCFDYDMNLLSDNIHSSNAMLQDLEDGNYRWIRNELNQFREEIKSVPVSW